ncbi:MAG: hypothetical protein HKN42_19295 [Granulosicoccus sp.]|nr:hypothetical protein [Granulosicoccus sp.]
MKTPTGFWLTAISSCLFVSGCDWVDSTGTQGAGVPVTEVFLDDAPVGGAIALNEKSVARITASRDTSASTEQTFAWSESALDQGNLANCQNLSNYNPTLAADSLAAACTDPAQCSLNFERVDTEDGVAEFQLLAPSLKAPVGVRYGLTVTDSAERVNTRDFDFCLLSINEAPLANDDTFVVLEGDREYFGPDELNLLSNDHDDDDVSNTEFRILPTLAKLPTKAAFFEIDEDGTFTYESSLEGILTDEFDSFDYQLSDGVHVSTATVTIRIVASNQAPELLDEIPPLTAVAGEPFLENLALYFSDPEGGTLSFSLANAAVLPDDGTLALDEEGVLSGTPDDDDVGSYVLTLIASDGGRNAQAIINLQVEAAPLVPENSPPEYIEDSVFDQIILLGRFIRPIIPEFVDPDGDLLTYAIIGRSSLPAGVEIDEDTGVVSGRPLARTWVRELRIEATDPSGATAVSDTFYIRVR